MTAKVQCPKCRTPVNTMAVLVLFFVAGLVLLARVKEG
jgi:hypothetical protein